MRNEAKSLDKIFLFLFILFPFLLVSGPFLPDLLVVFSCFYFFFNKNIQLLFNWQKVGIIFFILFFIYLNLNSIFSSENIDISLKVSVPYFRYFLFSLVMIYFLLNIENFKNKFFFSCVLCLTILLLDSSYQLVTGFNVLGFEIYQNRISSLFKDELILGSFTFKILIILISISLTLNYSKNKILYFQIFIFFISYLLIFMSNERVSFAYLIILFFTFCLIEFNLKKNIIILLTLVLLNSFIYFISPKSFERLLFHSLNQFKDSKTFFLSSYRHDLHYFTAIAMFKDKPILGNGLKSFRYKCNDPSYKIKEKIISDKKIFAPSDGIIEISDWDEIYLVTNYQKIMLANKNHNLTDIKLRQSQEIKKGQYLGSFYEFHNGCNTHPHNTHFQFLSELGLVGYFFLLIFISYLIRDIFRLLQKKILFKLKLNKFDKAYFISIVGVLIQVNPILPSGNFFNNYNSIFLFMNISFLIYFNYMKQKQ
jgi:hypothetical protein